LLRDDLALRSDTCTSNARFRGLALRASKPVR